MASLSSFFPKIRMEADEAPTSVLEDAVRRAARHLCFNGWVYVKDMSDIAVQAGSLQTDLSAATPGDWTGLNMVAVYNLYFKDEDDHEYRLDPATEEVYDAASRYWRGRSGRPEVYFTLFPTSVRLGPLPEKAGTLTKVKLVMQPEMSATTLPDLLYTRYEEIITEGAIASLQMQRKKPWSNWQRGYRRWRNFEDETKAHRRRVRSGNQPIALKVQINQGAL